MLEIKRYLDINIHKYIKYNNERYIGCYGEARQRSERKENGHNGKQESFEVEAIAIARRQRPKKTQINNIWGQDGARTDVDACDGVGVADGVRSGGDGEDDHGHERHHDERHT